MSGSRRINDWVCGVGSYDDFHVTGYVDRGHILGIDALKRGLFM